ncbi:hypothetical protein J7I98_36995 [Streptomyces sp. ISL-98]|uniref:hypothetical protein n=1 Tax=Streptomyces sp. ISL-98 TaxID=2819192 RepID=UPI001BED1D68|nr:hypothetical protein [Streptomyces sp. ISL-98]MBT2511320.1 hypothetical protein [Streptomyces sp. ISL-98]
MSLKRHVRTRVTVVRAGDTTTLVSLEGWYGGVLLAPVDTRIVVAAVGMSRHCLPDTQLWVMARHTARAAEDLDLRGWEPCSLPRAA